MQDVGMQDNDADVLGARGVDGEGDPAGSSSRSNNNNNHNNNFGNGDVATTNHDAFEEVDGGESKAVPIVAEGLGKDFDWEQYTAPYQGRTRIERLLFLAERSAPLRVSCSTAALHHVTASTKDVHLYHRALSIRNTSAKEGHPLLPVGQRHEADTEWCERTERSNRTELEKLDLELRNYQNNLIKESIRMAYRDLADHLRAIGDLSEAQKYYVKTRDYCSTSENVVEMCINVIEVSLELRDYPLVQGYVHKAEGLLEFYNPAAAAASASASANSGQPAARGGTTSGADAIGALFRAGGSSDAAMMRSNMSNEGPSTAAQREADASSKRQVAGICAKLHVASTLAYLGLGRYREAATSALEVDPSSSKAFATMASPSDIAAYTVLCSLSMFDRKELKERVLEQPNLGALLESDAQAQQLLDSFYNCEYKRALALLDQSKTRLLLDMYFWQHFPGTSRRITQRALRQFIHPFDALKIERLSASLGWQGTSGEGRAIDEVLDLIQARQISARLDLHRKVLITNNVEQRQSLFDHALKTGKQQTASAKRLLLRVDLLQNGLVVKVPADKAEA